MTFVRLITTSWVVLMLRKPGKLMFGGAPMLLAEATTRLPHEKFGALRIRVPSKKGTFASVRMLNA